MALIRFILLILSIYCFTKNVFADDFIAGFYAYPDKRYVDLVSDSKLNTLIAYGTDGLDKQKLKDFLDYAYSKNVKIIFSLKDCYKTSKWYLKINWCDTSNEIKLVECILSSVDTHPAIIGYYLADDATYTIGSKNLDIYLEHIKTIRRISKKPVFVNDVPPPRGRMYPIFSNTADYIIAGIYPIPDQDPKEVYNIIKQVIDITKKPVIAVIQAHGKYQYPSYRRNETTGRPPTFEEINLMVKYALDAGAKGIIFYSLFDIIKLPDGKERLKFLKNLGNDF